MPWRLQDDTKSRGLPPDNLCLVREGRFQGLDGIRGAAAMLVVFAHAFPIAQYRHTWLAIVSVISQYGWLGVELFFVLSGFLITGILLKNRDAENYFQAFYWHRTLRIFPLYFAFVAICLLVIPWLDPERDEFLRFNRKGPVWPYWAFLSNYVCCIDMQPHRLVAVLWSLAIEEQFYIVWAVLVRYFSLQRVVLVAAFLVVLGPVLRIILPLVGWSTPTVFYFTPAHFDPLALGALARIAFDYRRSLAKSAGRWWPAMLAVLVVVCALDSGTVHEAYRPLMMKLGYSVTAATCASLILFVVTRESIVQRFLDSRPMRSLGAYSYFIYLFHLVLWSFPVYVIWRNADMTALVLRKLRIHIWAIDFSTEGWRFLEVIVSVIIAGWLSYRFVERPILSLKGVVPYRGREQIAEQISPSNAGKPITEQTAP